MKYYAHFGHKDFILCLGYRSDVVKQYFLDYNECLSNDFVLPGGGNEVEMLGVDIRDWRVTFVDTGVNANLGQRLRAVAGHLKGEETFLANYADGLSDLPLPRQIEHFEKSGKLASFVSIRPTVSYHYVSHEPGGAVTAMGDASMTHIRINGGFFIFRRRIFDYIKDGEELVVEPFQRLIAENQLVTYPYDGFWMSMDTFKDRQKLEELQVNGNAPWQVWATSKGAP
jgi:glucose-1-phosphate cytidylyltransferase